MTDTKHPEALRLADRIKSSGQLTNLEELDAAAAELHCLHAENVALQQCYDAARLEIDHLRDATQSKLLAQPVAWMVYLPSIDTQHLYYSQEDMGYVDDVTNHADAEVTPLYEMAAPKAEVAPAGEYPPLPDFDSGDESIWNAIFKWEVATPGSDAHRKANAIESAIIAQLRDYVDADRAMRAKAAPAAAAGQCEDAIELLGKYKELCEEIKRGDSYHIGRIDAAISVLAQAAPQPAVQQGDADVEGAIKSAFFRFFGAGAERDWHTEPGGWFIEGYRAAHPAAPVAQGDAEQRQMDAKHAAIYRWMLSNVPDAWNIINNWCLYAEAGTDELHDALAARAQAKEGDQHG